ncbi:hypothetical protein F4801DRAFT_551431 [Xylaria longipes]|nr:hypothetical protein F4801DRAFT_551431 [Xylaria longipes]RYC57885.1 hypothetical protein CHU98_g8324 [Xylaria longipes]
MTTRGCKNSTMTIPGSVSPSGTAKDAFPPRNEQHGGQGLGTTTTLRVREVMSSDGNAQSWQGGPPGWTPGAGHYSWPWGGSPTTVLTLTTTVAYTQSSSMLGASQSSSPSPMASAIRKDGVNISGPIAASIGVGASVGLLGIGIVVYLCTKYSRRRRRQSSKEKGSDNVETTGDDSWPPYPFSASNESPVELSAIRQPQEMCAKSRPQEKDSSNRSGSADLD